MRVRTESRHRIELIVVPVVAAIAMALIIGAIMRDSTPGACPAIGWGNSLTITTTGNSAAVAAITVCGIGDCGPGAAAATTPASPVLGEDRATRAGGTDWSFQVGMNTPGTLTFQALDAGGVILTQKTVDLNWKRVGGTDQCGGPAVTNDVVLAIP
ncbi:hypothetical protein [Arthrobacter sp. 35W]|uniref:hypothetical protein n=1 Tax=Arthrobacter sp. 35W TaxID=1132441 RepID=UPI00042742E0|nr:hypothetical protein [Arthrobacter sp. 35W]